MFGVGFATVVVAGAVLWQPTDDDPCEPLRATLQVAEDGGDPEAIRLAKRQYLEQGCV